MSVLEGDEGVGRLLRGQVEEVDRLGLDFAALAKVLQDDAGWVVPKEKSF